jgi:hypothetical protein
LGDIGEIKAGAPVAPMTTTVGYREILGDIGRYRGDIGWGSGGPDDDDGGRPILTPFLSLTLTLTLTLF